MTGQQGQGERNCMTMRKDLWSGGWWRFSAYEIRTIQNATNGLYADIIVPSPSAELEWYDPWEFYRASLNENRSAPPYQSLLALLVSLGAFFDDSSNKWKLRDWECDI